MINKNNIKYAITDFCWNYLYLHILKYKHQIVRKNTIIGRTIINHLASPHPSIKRVPFQVESNSLGHENI
jgi:hypothetical protein